MEYPYVVTNPQGEDVLQAAAGCRYPKRVELDLMEHGYTIQMEGRKITKKEVK